MRINARTISNFSGVWLLENLVKLVITVTARLKNCLITCKHFQVTPDEFKGIELEDIYALENFYEVQLFAMSLKEDGSAVHSIYLKPRFHPRFT